MVYEYNIVVIQIDLIKCCKSKLKLTSNIEFVQYCGPIYGLYFFANRNCAFLSILLLNQISLEMNQKWNQFSFLLSQYNHFFLTFFYQMKHFFSQTSFRNVILVLLSFSYPLFKPKMNFKRAKVQFSLKMFIHLPTIFSIFFNDSRIYNVNVELKIY